MSKTNSKQNQYQLKLNINSNSKPTQLCTISKNRLRQQKAWDLALSPAKQIPMQAFMMWMSGNGVQIFSVMMVYMLIKGAITSTLSVNQVFKSFMPQLSSSIGNPSSTNGQSTYDLRFQKLSFITFQLGLLGLGLYKVNTMGLLPTRLSDWIMYEPRPAGAERFLSEEVLGIVINH
ncbi:uncharacterized protein MELLADRAFT_76275 [Melampsora larici-populina 98AG31]|uniref:ER membrane protein complex subunit 4 n=1 Tax=Melampsora larici-populina (strain 98AG31 / pathotype 3-4-7) TaxID=747676 RepID=F4R3M2_MELLP|nr:uncharacterized protein MELLADRAFT_76275 [Melampsora larici-populina 98AG31]EGG13145.1 hypothetical protein MELLADRAFT_76275 [Melampsora larici-populina 98AG31]